MNNKFLSGFWMLLLALVAYSCSDLHFNLPPGPKGDDGESVYEIWKNQVIQGNVDWSKDRVTLADFLMYIKGEKGDKGADGRSAYELWKEMIAKGNVDDPHNPGAKWSAGNNAEVDFWNFITGRDGNTPYVGTNDNWWIGGKDTGVPTRGKNGKDGADGKSAYQIWKELVLHNVLDWDKDRVSEVHFFQYLKGNDGKDGKDGIDGITPHIGANGNWFFGDQDTRIPARGKDGMDGVAGTTPHIGQDGNWWIGDNNTRVPARGKDGQNGQNGENGKDGVSPHIGQDGNWWIGDKNTGVPARGNDGDTGVAGKSAYELWTLEVQAGTIEKPDGSQWPATENTINDFWLYLKGAKGDKGNTGANGNDGMSAYEFWKKEVLAGSVDDPRNPGDAWPTTEVTEADFYKFLTGKDGLNGSNGANGTNGIDGKDGKSAYELWKEELERRCGQADALIDYKTGDKWDCNKNTVDDFLDFIRGRDGADGADGADGMPGEPGSPGKPVEVLRGAPNVIAEYTIQSQSEYVRTLDGGVKFNVFDSEGQPAPAGSKVKGLPGMNPTKEYLTDANGSFIVPKEDLPWIHDVKSRWGSTAEVIINNGQNKVEKSAQNTYVPNRIEMRLILVEDATAETNKMYLDHRVNLSFRIQRKTGPNSPWEDLPNYLPAVTDIEYEAFRTTGQDPTQITGNALPLISGTTVKRTSEVFKVGVTRYVIQNAKQYKNEYANYWDGQNNYFTVKQKTGYYGLTPTWNGVSLMAPYQISPYLKKLHLKTKMETMSGSDHFFNQVTGEFDFAHIKFDQFYEKLMTARTLASEVVLVEPVPMAADVARSQKAIFVLFSHTTAAGPQESKSTNKYSSVADPTFSLGTVYLKSKVSVGTYNVPHMYPSSAWQGFLEAVPGSTEQYKIRLATEEMSEVPVTYEP